MKWCCVFIVVAFLLLQNNPCYGDSASVGSAPAIETGTVQNDSTIYKIDLLDGQVLMGRLHDKTDSTVSLQLATGDKLVLPRKSIKSIKQEAAVRNASGGSYRLNDPNRTRYLFSPSAFMMPKGEMSFSQQELLFSMFSAGLTNNFSVQVGAAVPGWFASGGGGFNFLLAVKMGGKVAQNFHIAGGIWAFTVLVDDGMTLGLPFLAVTIGNDDANVSINGSIPFGASSGEFHLGDLYWYTLSGSLRVADHIALISENWIFSFAESDNEGTQVVGSFGVRFMGRNLSADAALMFINGSEIPLPWVNFTYAFGR